MTTETEILKDSEKVKRFMKAYGGEIQFDPWQEDLLYRFLARDGA